PSGGPTARAMPPSPTTAPATGRAPRRSCGGRSCRSSRAICRRAEHSYSGCEARRARRAQPSRRRRGGSVERKWWTLIAVAVAIFMLLLDITVVNVALPDIQRSLHASFRDLQWVVNAYALTLAAFLLTAGSLADLFGRRRGSRGRRPDHVGHRLGVDLLRKRAHRSPGGAGNAPAGRRVARPRGDGCGLARAGHLLRRALLARVRAHPGQRKGLGLDRDR